VSPGISLACAPDDLVSKIVVAGGGTRFHKRAVAQDDRSVRSALVNMPTLAGSVHQGPKENARAIHAGVSVAPLPRPNERFLVRFCFRGRLPHGSLSV
jgi:hypothetical protein